MMVLVHLPDELVDLLLPVTGVTTLDVVEPLLDESSLWGRQLDGPQEVVGLLEGWSDGEDLVHEVLNANNVVLSQVVLDDGVVGEREAALVDLSVAPLVDELLDGLQVRVTVRHVGLHLPEHVHDGLVGLEEDGVVDLPEPEEPEDTPGLGVHVADSPDADDQQELWLRWNVEGTLGAGGALHPHEVVLLGDVLLGVLLRALEDDLLLLLEGRELGLAVGGLLSGHCSSLLRFLSTLSGTGAILSLVLVLGSSLCVGQSPLALSFIPC